MKTLKLLMIFSMTLAPLALGQTTQSRIEMDKVDSKPLPIDWNLGLELTAGNTSNAVRLAGGPSGTYQSVKPEIQLELPLSNNLYVIAVAEGELKKFNDETVAKNADQNQWQAGLNISHFIGQHFEWGVEGLYNSFDGREVDFATGSVDGLPSEYKQLGGYAYSRFNSRIISLEVGAGTTNKDFSTTTVNELGRVFEDDYRSQNIQGIAELQISNHWQVEISGALEDKKYLQRQGRFTEGTPNDGTNNLPLLRETSQIVGSKIKYEVYKSSIEFNSSFKKSKDRVFGAEDADTLALGGKLNVNIISPLDLELNYSVSTKDYGNFVADVLDNPQSEEKRSDNIDSFSAKIKYQWLKNLETQLVYSNNVTDSNYEIINYREQSVAAGIKVVF